MSESEKIKVFISYAAEDYEMAKKLYDDLNKAGMKPWIDKEDLLSGQDWKITIQQAINASRYFLLLTSKHSVSKGFFQKEQRTALELRDELPLDRIYTIPVKLDDTEPIDERVKGLFPADFSKDYEEGWKQIMKVLKDTSDIDGVEQKTKQLDFVNRKSELEIITHQYSPPYLLIVGPLGYGKTKLFEVVKCQLQRQWLCVSISISKEIRSVNDIAKEILISFGKNKNGNFDFKTSEEAGLEVGSYILQEVLSEDRKKILIQIDDAESLEDNSVKELVNHFIPAIADTLKDEASATLKVMIAGRYITGWQQLSYEIRFKPILLTPFDFDAVYQAVANFDFSSRKAVMNIEYQKEFSARLMYFTGGHIKAMSDILTDYYRLPMKVITKREEEFYEIVKPVVEDIKSHIHPDLKDIMETLSVVRRFNSRLLQNFIQNNLIKWEQSEIKLEDSLLQTYLVNRKDGFLQDDISRRLLAIHLRRNDLDRFLRICEQAISFYEGRLNDPKSWRPDIIAVELLFQKLLYISYEEKGSKEDFLNTVTDILNILVSGRDSMIVMDFIQLLEEDWEFQFTLNYLFREGNYKDNYPFNELKKKVIDFSEKLKKGGQHA